VVAFDVGADAPRNGGGWELVRRDGNGSPFREMHVGRPVSTLAVLDPGIGAYRIFCHIFHGASAEVIGSLQLKVAGAPLARTGLAVRQWPAGPALVAEWSLPQEHLAASDGRVEFVFEADLRPSGSALWLGRLGCVPEPGLPAS